jgi:sulfur carrier protein
MKILLNGETFDLTSMDLANMAQPHVSHARKISLRQLVSELGLDNKRLAIEVNQEIVPHGEYEGHFLQEADHVEIVQAIGGG